MSKARQTGATEAAPTPVETLSAREAAAALIPYIERNGVTVGDVIEVEDSRSFRTIYDYLHPFREQRLTLFPERGNPIGLVQFKPDPDTPEHNAAVVVRLVARRSGDGPVRRFDREAVRHLRLAAGGVDAKPEQFTDLRDPVKVADVSRAVGRKAGRSDALGRKMKARGYRVVRVGNGPNYCERDNALRMFNKHAEKIRAL